MTQEPKFQSFQRQVEHGLSRRNLLKGAAAASGALLLERIIGAERPAFANAPVSGPSTTVDAYVLPSVAGVQIKPFLTVGNRPADNGYRMVGIPDGMGAFGDGPTFTLLVNHEVSAAGGIVRAHGSKGAFVSEWTVERESLRVLAGRDLTRSAAQVHLWDAATSQYVVGTTAWDRLCSATLADVKAFRHGDRGTPERIYLNGEETTEGRAWARIATGTGAGEAWQLPRLGRMAFENAVPNSRAGDHTIVALLEDGNLNTAPVASNFPSELYFYIGTKQLDGTTIERAGLTNGRLYGLKATRDGSAVGGESDVFGLGDAGSGYQSAGRFTLVEMGPAGDVSAMSATQLEQDAVDKGVLRFQRTEDGSWDPRGGRDGDFYFVTTASFTTNSRLWRVRFDDLDDPAAGGTIEILLRGTEGQHQFDNMTVDGLGRVILQEDPGNQVHLAKVWMYSIASGAFTEIAHHNPHFFSPEGAGFLTTDEESSGIFDAHDVLGQGWFLFGSMAHYASTDPELVRGGQLLAMYVNPAMG